MSSRFQIIWLVLLTLLIGFHTFRDITPARASVDGPYQLMHHSNTSATAGVFKLDTATGEVTYCYLPPSGGAEVICTRAVR